MADTVNDSQSLREEIETLKNQLGLILKTLETKKSEKSSEIIDKITRIVENLQNDAGERTHKICEAGEESLNEICDYVRRKPVRSLAIAFGAGCVLACLLKH